MTSNLIYTATSTGIYKSTDGGITFSNMITGSVGLGFMDLVVFENNGNYYLYAWQV
jgi:hypothetical protein